MFFHYLALFFQLFCLVARPQFLKVFKAQGLKFSVLYTKDEFPFLRAIDAVVNGSELVVNLVNFID